jgi:hypothetical protein
VLFSFNANFRIASFQVDNVAIYIPMKTINEDDANFMQILKDIPPEEVMRKQLEIEKIAPRLQYAVVSKLGISVVVADTHNPSSSCTAFTSFLFHPFITQNIYCII